MKPWKQQRDGIVERTLEFVEDVIEAKAGPVGPREALDTSAFQHGFAKPTVAAPLALENPSIEQPAAAKSAASETGSFERTIDVGMHAERDEIIRRVTAFRNLQIKIRQDREQYCDAVLAKTRAALGHQAKSSQ